MGVTVHSKPVKVETTAVEVRNRGDSAQLMFKLRRSSPVHDCIIVDYRSFADIVDRGYQRVSTDPMLGGEIHLTREQAEEMVKGLQDMLA